MTFADLPTGVSVFLDANTLLYHFTADLKHGGACTDLLDRIEPRAHRTDVHKRDRRSRRIA